MLQILVVLLLSTGGLSDLQCSTIPGRLKQVDASGGQVYGVNDNDEIFRYVNNDWSKLPGLLIHVTVGPAGIWGVNRQNDIFTYQENKWFLINGTLKQVDAGGNHILVGVNNLDYIFCLNNGQISSNTFLPSYTALDGRLKYYSCGPNGCWGVNSAGDIYYRYDVTSSSCQGSRWLKITGGLSMVEVGTDGSVYGVNNDGIAYNRLGVSAGNPIGTSWSQLAFNDRLKHLSYDNGILWLISQKGIIYKCSV